MAPTARWIRPIVQRWNRAGEVLGGILVALGASWEANHGRKTFPGGNNKHAFFLAETMLIGDKTLTLDVS